MKNIITIAKKELSSALNNPTAYIVMLAFLLLWHFLFFRSVFLVGEVSLNGLLQYLPWLFLVIIPVLSMGSFATEKSDGTLEFLLTHPVRQAELIIGKFLGILLLVAGMLCFIFPLAWSFSRYGGIEWGIVLAQYLAGVLLAGLLLSLGMLISSIFRSNISAFLISAISSFFLVIVGTEFFGSRLPLGIASFLEQLSVMTHFDSMVRGVIDLRDMWYFVSLIGILLSFTHLFLLKEKYGNRKSAFRSYQLGAVLLCGIIVASNIVGTKIPGRLDLTSGKIYTLSEASKEIVQGVPDIVNITLFVSDKLPAQLQPVLRETKDILDDYEKFSGSNVRVVQKNPTKDSDARSDALARGIGPVRFNVVSQEEFQVKEGYLGIALSYGGKDEIIPFVQDARDLEYQLSSLIHQLTVENKPKIGVLSGHGEKSFSAQYGIFAGELGKQFDITTITASAPESSEESDDSESQEVPKEIEIPDDIKMLVVAHPSENYEEKSWSAINDFIENGGSVLWLIDGVNTQMQTLTATANQNALIEELKALTGVEVQKNLVYDLRSNESVSFGGGAMRYILPYALWVRALPSQDILPSMGQIDGVTMPWTSSLSIDDGVVAEKGWTRVDLLETSPSAGVQIDSFALAPDSQFSQSDLTRHILATALYEAEGESKMVIVGDADLLGDDALRDNTSNFTFGLGSISWLVQDTALSSISRGESTRKSFVFAHPSEPAMLKFGNMIFAFVVIAGYGTWRLMKRRKMRDVPYEFSGNEEKK